MGQLILPGVDEDLDEKLDAEERKEAGLETTASQNQDFYGTYKTPEGKCGGDPQSLIRRHLAYGDVPSDVVRKAAIDYLVNVGGYPERYAKNIARDPNKAAYMVDRQAKYKKQH